tara:strand:+ start:70 stop:885 length:816 start_codon:yes stop_codon:yes gene_type:complete
MSNYNWINKINELEEYNQVCVGVDPIPKELNKIGFKDVYEWCSFIVENTSDYTSIYKFQLAYFEEWGIHGYESLLSILKYIQRKFPEKILIGDGKRSDIGSTAEAYAKAMYEYWKFDVATVNPYLGSDSIIPFSERNGAIILCKTSNSSSSQLQNIIDQKTKKTIYESVIDIVNKNNKNNNLGLVVGATFPEDLKKIRSENLKIPLLIPGIGYQGGDSKLILNAAKGKGYNIINSSRGISFPKNKIVNKSKYSDFVVKSVKSFREDICSSV